MRKIKVWCLVFACLVPAFAFNGALAQKAISGGGGGSSGTNPVPVAVSNFPGTQSVTGTVSVGNFPLTVNVAGTVDVGNLPFDENGSLQVSSTAGAPPAFRFIGFSTGTVSPGPDDIDNEFPIFECNRTSQAEFPGTRICLWQELSRSIPTPDWSECVLLASSLDSPSIQAACYDASGGGQISTDPRPVACCGP